MMSAPIVRGTRIVARAPIRMDVLRGRFSGRGGACPSGVGKICVYEGLLDDAIAVADSAPQDQAMVEQVADAAIQAFPDWVIRTGCEQAERIMDGGQAPYFHQAIAWL
jgi:hypothetical protein